MAPFPHTLTRHRATRNIHVPTNVPHNNIRIALNDHDDHGSIDLYTISNDDPIEIDWRWHADHQHFSFTHAGITYTAHNFADIRGILQLFVPHGAPNTLAIIFVLPQTQNIAIEDGIHLYHDVRAPTIMQSKYLRQATQPRHLIPVTPTVPLPTNANTTFADILAVHVPIIAAHYAPMRARTNAVFYRQNIIFRPMIPAPHPILELRIEYDVRQGDYVTIDMILYDQCVGHRMLRPHNLTDNAIARQSQDVVQCINDRVTPPNTFSGHQHVDHLRHVQSFLRGYAAHIESIDQRIHHIATTYYTTES